jgi:hypothetical protein
MKARKQRHIANVSTSAVKRSVACVLLWGHGPSNGGAGERTSHARSSFIKRRLTLSERSWLVETVGGCRSRRSKNPSFLPGRHQGPELTRPTDCAVCASSELGTATPARPQRADRSQGLGPAPPRRRAPPRHRPRGERGAEAGRRRRGPQHAASRAMTCPGESSWFEPCAQQSFQVNG